MVRPGPYKWSNPYNWLADVSRGWEEAVLYAALCRLAAKLDSDTIQSAFENEMDVDGYFEEVGHEREGAN